MNNINQKELAIKLNISLQQYQKYERGVTKIPAAMLYTISQILGVEMSYFFIGSHLSSCAINTYFVREESKEYDYRDSLLSEIITIFKGVKNIQLRKKIVTVVKLIASEEKSLIEDKYD